MNKLQSTVLALLAISLSWGGSAQAQEQTKASPIEFFACNYMKGKDINDLKKVGMEFGEWSKENNMGYAAWILTPQFHGPEVPFDVGWLGGYADGNAFGKGMDAWLNTDGKLIDSFAKVMDCSDSHQLASSVAINAPATPPGDGVVMFSQCTVKEGSDLAETYMAHKELGGAMKEMGAKSSSWLFYPSLGAGHIDFHYWSVIAAQNYTELGAAWEMYTNGGGWQKRQEMLGDKVACRSPAVFDAHVVVAPDAN